MSFSMADAAYGEAARGLGLVVRLDAARSAGTPPWTVAIQGVDRGDAYNPHDAALNLRERLLDLVRDAEEGRLARARLEKAREALGRWDAAAFRESRAFGGFDETAEIVAKSEKWTAFAALRAALEGETT